MQLQTLSPLRRRVPGDAGEGLRNLHIGEYAAIAPIDVQNDYLPAGIVDDGDLGSVRRPGSGDVERFRSRVGFEESQAGAVGIDQIEAGVALVTAGCFPVGCSEGDPHRPRSAAEPRLATNLGCGHPLVCRAVDEGWDGIEASGALDTRREPRTGLDHDREPGDKGLSRVAGGNRARRGLEVGRGSRPVYGPCEKKTDRQIPIIRPTHKSRTSI